MKLKTPRELEIWEETRRETAQKCVRLLRSWARDETEDAKEAIEYAANDLARQFGLEDGDG